MFFSLQQMASGEYFLSAPELKAKHRVERAESRTEQKVGVDRSQQEEDLQAGPIMIERGFGVGGVGVCGLSPIEAKETTSENQSKRIRFFVERSGLRPPPAVGGLDQGSVTSEKEAIRKSRQVLKVSCQIVTLV